MKLSRKKLEKAFTPLKTIISMMFLLSISNGAWAIGETTLTNLACEGFTLGKPWFIGFSWMCLIAGALSMVPFIGTFLLCSWLDLLGSSIRSH